MEIALEAIQTENIDHALYFNVWLKDNEELLMDCEDI